MVLTHQEVQQSAQLARLEIAESDKEVAARQLSSIVDYIAQLRKVDTNGIEYQYQVEGLWNATADDVVLDCDAEIKKRILASMPYRIGELLKVKGIFSE